MKRIKVLKNAIWIIGCKIIKAILTLIVTMITARYLGPSNYGLISYAASLVTVVTPLMKLGLDSTLVYELVNNPKDEGKILGSTLLMCFVSGILCLIGIITFVSLVNAGEKDTLIVCSLYGVLLIFQAFEMIQYWFQAKLLSKYCSISMLLSYVIITLFQLYLLITSKSVYWFALSYSIDYLLISIFLIFFYKKNGKSKFKFSKKTFSKLLKNSKYYIISSMMVTIFAQTDKVMLKLMINNKAVGYYSAAVTCANMLAFVFAAVIDSIRPTVYEAQKESKMKFENRMIQMYSIIIYFSLFVSLFITIFSPLIIKILYGNSYTESIPALRLIVWYTTFSYLGTIRNVWIIAVNKQKHLWKINLSGALLNIILNSFLIPLYGIMGAAFASLMTQIFTNFIIGFIIKDIKDNNKLMVKSLNPMILIHIFENMLPRKI